MPRLAWDWDWGSSKTSSNCTAAPSLQRAPALAAARNSRSRFRVPYRPPKGRRSNGTYIGALRGSLRFKRFPDSGQRLLAKQLDALRNVLCGVPPTHLQDLPRTTEEVVQANDGIIHVVASTREDRSPVEIVTCPKLSGGRCFVREVGRDDQETGPRQRRRRRPWSRYRPLLPRRYDARGRGAVEGPVVISSEAKI